MPERFIGLILAGGAGTRMGGVAKHRIRLEGRNLLDHAKARLAPQCDTILLSVSSQDQICEHESEGAIVLPDCGSRSFGPASGLIAGANWCANHAPDSFLATMAVDAPLLPTDFVSRCRSRIDASGLAVAMVAGRILPTHGLWSPPAWKKLVELEVAGHRGPSLMSLVESATEALVKIDCDEPESPVSGINTVSDLLTLSRLMRGRTTLS